MGEKSRYLTTFSTHYVGLGRFKRWNFGVNCAAEIFQNAIRESLSGLKGEINISDDIVVFGINEPHHDASLKAVLDRIQQCELTLNKKKCEFKKRSLVFQDYVFSGQGIAPDGVFTLIVTVMPFQVKKKGFYQKIASIGHCSLVNLPSKYQPAAFKNLHENVLAQKDSGCKIKDNNDKTGTVDPTPERRFYIVANAAYATGVF